MNHFSLGYSYGAQLDYPALVANFSRRSAHIYRHATQPLRTHSIASLRNSWRDDHWFRSAEHAALFVVMGAWDSASADGLRIGVSVCSSLTAYSSDRIALTLSMECLAATPVRYDGSPNAAAKSFRCSHPPAVVVSTGYILTVVSRNLTRILRTSCFQRKLAQTDLHERVQICFARLWNRR